MIKTFDFSESGKKILNTIKKGKDWPVVYLLNNDKQMYIGETSNIYNRMAQHLSDNKRKGLKSINVIFDNEFNKSAVLDIEQSLIQLCNADGKYRLQNLNSGQSSKHDYFEREKYIHKIDSIWLNLRHKKLADQDILTLRNSEIFKYSPYNSLTSEQREVANEIFKDIVLKLSNKQDGTAIVNGLAGTGKTILGINIISTLVNASKYSIDISESTNDYSDEQLAIHELRKYIFNHGEIKVAIVLPMTSIRKTIKKVFKLTKNGLKASMVIGPHDVNKEKYDLLIVDESHRLCKRKNIANIGQFDQMCLNLGLDKDETTQLDWIVQNSKYRILFYDENQSVKASDIDNKQFYSALKQSHISKFNLTTQMRCNGGNDYLDYIDNIFTCKQDKYETINNFDFKLFNNAYEMVNEIKELNSIHGLCRNVAGYSWEWISQGKKSLQEVIDENLEDIEIDGHKYVWNISNKEWILRKESIDEIGCIHTTQGYDLNYVGLIFGREIDYDEKSNKIVVDLTKFYDKNVKKATDVETVKEYIVNAYKVMLTRGIKGCYVYAFNVNLRKYLANFIR